MKGDQINWEKTVRYKVNVYYKRKVFEIMCEEDPDGIFALYINGEYSRDADELPTHKELVSYINDTIMLDRMSFSTFPSGSEEF